VKPRDARPTLVVLGAAGDLADRLLLPGLAGLVSRRHLAINLIGSDRAGWDDDRWRARVRQAFSGGAEPSPAIEAIIGATRFVQADVTAPDDLDRLLRACSAKRLILYFALPPAVTEQACRALTGRTLPADTRLVLEKPFGSDAESAERLNRVLTRLVPEDQIYRVDHYLGLSTVLNIFGLRYTNRVLESVLDSTHVASVDILLHESLTLEGRAGYYDRAGALIDMLQSHALHVLSLLAMEPPSTITALDVRDGAAAVLRATRVWHDDPVGSSRRARYTAGTTNGRAVPSSGSGWAWTWSRGTCRPTGRSWPACSTAIPPCRCAGTRRCRPGGSWSRWCGRGARTPYPCRSTRPAATARRRPDDPPWRVCRPQADR
jgi:glucose-6-phosphate 1-dehydrogenase